MVRNVPFWGGAILTGLAAVGYARAFKWAGDLASRTFARHPLVFTAFAPGAFLLSWFLVHRLAPAAAGSGIPQVMAATELDPQRDDNRISVLLGSRTALVKIMSSLICVLGGGAIGREGPTLQISASIFHSIGVAFKRTGLVINPVSWIIAGGAAGIAAAFNTPLGGIVFAIEELSSMHFSQLRTHVISAVIISGVVSQWIMGSYLYLGYPAIQSIPFSFMPLAVLTGILAGLAGGFFGETLFFFVTAKSRFKRTLESALIALGCGLLIAFLALALGPATLGSGTETISELLFHPSQPQHHPSSWPWIAARFIAPILSYLSGGAGGIFAPSLAAGATIGAKIAALTSPEQAHLMILLGMIGFLTGVTRAPFTAFVLVLEMTDHHSAIFPMMLSAVCASAAARALDPHSFYEKMKARYLH